MPDDKNAQFRAITEALAVQGEDREEMAYWADIFPNLPEDKREQIFALFKEELEKLKSLS